MITSQTVQQVGSGITTTVDNGYTRFSPAKSGSLFFGPQNISIGVITAKSISAVSGGLYVNNVAAIIPSGADAQIPLHLPMSATLQQYICNASLSGATIQIIYRDYTATAGANSLGTLTPITTSGSYIPLTGSNLNHSVLNRNVYYFDIDNSSGKGIVQFSGLEIKYTVASPVGDNGYCG